MAYYGHVPIKNGVKVACSIKMDMLQFADFQKFTERQDLWALPMYIQSFVICVRGLASGAQILVHALAVILAQFRDLFRQLDEFYEFYDCRASVASMVEVYKEHIMAQFTRPPKFALKTDLEMPPRVVVVILDFRVALDHLAQSTRQGVSSYIIPDQKRGRTGSQYKD